MLELPPNISWILSMILSFWCKFFLENVKFTLNFVTYSDTKIPTILKTTHRRLKWTKIFDSEAHIWDTFDLVRSVHGPFGVVRNAWSFLTYYFQSSGVSYTIIWATSSLRSFLVSFGSLIYFFPKKMHFSKCYPTVMILFQLIVSWIFSVTVHTKVVFRNF